MTLRITLFGLGLLTIATGAAVVLAQVDETAGPKSTAFPVDIIAGAELYAQYCASCHGANLEGQENWRSPAEDGRLPAPPHDETGHTWHHADGVLFTYTKLGGQATLAEQGIDFDSGMPGFGELLNDAEIWNILSYIKSTWPERMRNIQAERTAADLAAQGE